MEGWRLDGTLALVCAAATFFCCIAVHEMVTNWPPGWGEWLWVIAAAMWLVVVALRIRNVLQEDNDYDDES